MTENSVPPRRSITAIALNVLLAAASGALYGFAFPNAALPFLAFFAFVPLLLAIRRARSGVEAFLLGWFSQTVAWMIMAPWVVRVMSHYGGLPVATGVAVFIGMCLILASYGGLFSWAVYRFRPETGFHRWLLIPPAWAAVEYARTYLLSGFPWNLLSTSIVDYTSFVMFSRVAGPYLVSAMIVFMSVTITWTITQRVQMISRVLVIGGTLIILLVWWASGLVASKLVTRPTGMPTSKAALLQPNISQEVRWDPENTLRIYRRMMTMTDEAIANGAEVVIWPESTVPLAFANDDTFRGDIERLSREKNVDIILGSVAEDRNGATKLWNSAFLVEQGKIVGRYDKIRLVPFGEYVPLRKMLFFAEKMVHAVGDFQFGTNDRPLVGRHAYGPAICYEIVFPQISRRQVKNGADVLVTITNDAWFDGSSAPRQHLNQARLRAIETDRYLLRAATTGISAFIDSAGIVLKELPMGQQGIVYADFQSRRTTTPYVRFGDWFAWFSIILSIGGIVATRKEFARRNS